MTAPARHVWIALAVVYVVWGSTYFGIKIAVETIPPLLAAGSRFLTAALLLAAILAWRGTSLRITRRELVASAVAGGLLLALGVGVVHVAETRIDSSVAAIIAGTVPLQIIGFRLLAAESPARATRLSTLAGLVGLALVVAPGLGAGSTALGLAVFDLRDDRVVDGIVPVEEPAASAEPVCGDGLRDGARRNVPHARRRRVR